MVPGVQSASLALLSGKTTSAWSNSVWKLGDLRGELTNLDKRQCGACNILLNSLSRSRGSSTHKLFFITGGLLCVEVNCVWKLLLGDKLCWKQRSRRLARRPWATILLAHSLELGGLQVSSEVPIGRRARVSSLQRGEELMKQFLDDHKRVNATVAETDNRLCSEVTTWGSWW